MSDNSSSIMTKSEMEETLTVSVCANCDVRTSGSIRDWEMYFGLDNSAVQPEFICFACQHEADAATEGLSVLRADFVDYCRDTKRMHRVASESATYDEVAIGAIELLDHHERDPEAHVLEEFTEVLEAIKGDSTTHVLEEIGDLLFTAVRLARAKGHDINMSDVVWTNHHKLSLRKEK